jgi:hypothetical protein
MEGGFKGSGNDNPKLTKYEIVGFIFIFLTIVSTVFLCLWLLQWFSGLGK